jgi:hypothetical protein
MQGVPGLPVAVEGLEPSNKNAGKSKQRSSGGHFLATFRPDSIIVFNDRLLDDGFTQEQADRILAVLQDCTTLNQES